MDLSLVDGNQQTIDTVQIQLNPVSVTDVTRPHIRFPSTVEVVYDPQGSAQQIQDDLGIFNENVVYSGFGDFSTGTLTIWNPSGEIVSRNTLGVINGDPDLHHIIGETGSRAGTEQWWYLYNNPGQWSWELTSDGTTVVDTGTFDVVTSSVDGNGPAPKTTFDAGPDQAVEQGTTVNIDRSNVPAGSAWSESWAQTPENADAIGPVTIDFTWIDPNNQWQGFTAASFTAPTLTAADAPINVVIRGAVNGQLPGEFTVTVSHPDYRATNIDPVANAGPDVVVNSGDGVILDGRASSDGDGDALTYLWTQTAGTVVTLSDTTIVRPAFTAPIVPADQPAAVLTFSLAVNDGRTTVTDTVDVTVNPTVVVNPADVPASNAKPGEIKAVAISHMATLGMKHYDTLAEMLSATEQFLQFTGQALFCLETMSFYKKLNTSTSSITDYFELVQFQNLGAEYSSVDITFGPLADRLAPGDVTTSYGDMYFDTTNNELFISDGARWLSPVKGTTGGITFWNPTGTYTINSLVIYEGDIYRNMTGNNISTSNPSTDIENWVPITDNVVTEEYDQLKTYQPGDRVIVNGITWEALVETSKLPSATANEDWQIYSDALYACPRYSAIQDYNTNDIISYGSKIYRNVSGVNSGRTPDVDSTNWREVFGSEDADRWDVNTQYDEGEEVVFEIDGEDKTFISVVDDNLGAEPGTKTSWEEIPDDRWAVNRYVSRRKYVQNDIINHGGVLYKNLTGEHLQHLTPETDVDNWEALQFIENKIPLFSTEADYARGNMVGYDGGIWVKLYRYNWTNYF